MACPVGIDVDHEDFLSLMIACSILGGGDFSSRLMLSVRDEKGLTYGICSFLDGMEWGLDGYWILTASLAIESIKVALSEIQSQIENWYKFGITETEINFKKLSYIGSYRVSLAGLGSLCDTIHFVTSRGKPLSYIDEYPKLLENLTLSKVKYLYFTNF